MPASPAKVSGRAPAGLSQPRHLGEPPCDERRLGVVAEPPARPRLRRRARSRSWPPRQLDADQVRAGVDAEARRVNCVLEAARRAPRPRSRAPPPPGGPGRSPRRGSGPERTATGRPGTTCESRRPLPGSRPFVRLRSGASPGRAATTSRKARLGTATHTSSAAATGASSSGSGLDAAQVGVGHVARVAAGRGDRARLLGVAAARG